MSSEVRVRFAPSPSGYLHVGNARTAILNFIFARHTGGTLVLRIEDTDRERSQSMFERAIMVDLEWLGVHWDEGPDRRGECDHYRQSERSAIYKEYLQLLVEKGKTYPCFCSPDRLQTAREKALARGEQPVYDGRCRDLSAEQVQAKLDAGEKPVYRFRVEPGIVGFDDLVKGRIEFDAANIGDFVIARSDGRPMYNFAATVDDLEMRISHVIRGDDHVSNTPLQLMIYRALGAEPPHFAHIPMILGPGRERLSKRHGATAVEEFRQLGYLPQAMLNFLSLLSWSSPSGEEVLSLDRLIEEFDFARVSSSAAVFDPEKLNWMNSVYIRQLSVDELLEKVRPFLNEETALLEDEARLREVVTVLQEGLVRLADIREKVTPLTRGEVDAGDEEVMAVLRTGLESGLIEKVAEEVAAVDEFSGEAFQQAVKKAGKAVGARGRDLFMPVRVAITGQTHGPALPEVAEILGREMCLERLGRASTLG